jgi:hypothetical protein
MAMFDYLVAKQGLGLLERHWHRKIDQCLREVRADGDFH